MKKILVLLLSIQIADAVFTKRSSSSLTAPSSTTEGLYEFKKLIQSRDESKAIQYFDEDLRFVLPNTDKSLGDALKPFFQTFYNKRAMIPEGDETLQDLVDSLASGPRRPPSSSGSDSSEWQKIFGKLMQRRGTDNVSSLTAEEAQQLIDDWLAKYDLLAANSDALFKQLDEILRKKFPGLPKTGPLTAAARNECIKKLDLAALSAEEQEVVAGADLLKVGPTKIKEGVTAAIVESGKGGPPPPPPPPGFAPPPPPPPPGNGPPPPPAPIFGGKQNPASPTSSGNLVVEEVIQAPTIPQMQDNIKKLIAKVTSVAKEGAASPFDNDASTFFGIMARQMEKIQKFYELHPNNSENAHMRLDPLLPSMKLITFLFKMLGTKIDYVVLLKEINGIDDSGQEWKELVSQVSDEINKQVEKSLTGGDKKDVTILPQTDTSSSTGDDDQPSPGGMLAGLKGFKGLKKTGVSAGPSVAPDDGGVQDSLIKSLVKWYVVIEKIAECKKEIVDLDISISKKTSKYLSIEEASSDPLLVKDNLQKIKDDIKVIRENIKKVNSKIKQLEAYRDKTKIRLVRGYKDYIAELEKQVAKGDNSGVANLKIAYEKTQKSTSRYDLKGLGERLTKSLNVTEQDYSSWQLDALSTKFSPEALTVLPPSEQYEFLSKNNQFPIMQQSFVDCLMGVWRAIDELGVQKELTRIESLKKIQEDSTDGKEGVISLFTKAVYGFIAWEVFYILRSGGDSDDSENSKALPKIVKTMRENNMPATIVPTDVKDSDSAEPLGQKPLFNLYSNVFIAYCELYLVEPTADDTETQGGSDILTSRDLGSLKDYIKNYRGAVDIIKTYDAISSDQFMFAKDFMNPADVISEAEIVYMFDKSPKELDKRKKAKAFDVEKLSFDMGFLCSKIKLQLDTFINYQKNDMKNYRMVLLAPYVFNFRTDILVASDEGKKPRYMINASMITEDDINAPKATILDLVIMAWRLDLLDKDPLLLTTPIAIDNYLKSNATNEEIKKELRKILVEALKKKVIGKYTYATYLMYDKGITNKGPIVKGDFFEGLYAKDVKKIRSSGRDSLGQDQTDQKFSLSSDDFEKIVEDFTLTLTPNQIGKINLAKSLFPLMGQQPLPPIIKVGSIILNSKNSVFYAHVGKITGLEFPTVRNFIEAGLEEEQKKLFKSMGMYSQIGIVNIFYDQLYNAIPAKSSGSSNVDDVDELD